MWPHWVALRRYFGGALDGLGETAGVGAFDTGFPVAYRNGGYPD